MDEYIWTMCRFSHKYGDVNPVMQFGQNWEFVSAPEAQSLRVFTLKYGGLCYYTKWSGPDNNWVADYEAHPKTNLWLLESFYQTHLKHLPFTINVPSLGPKTCRFKETFESPFGIADGSGWVEGFEVVLQEVR